MKEAVQMNSGTHFEVLSLSHTHMTHMKHTTHDTHTGGCPQETDPGEATSGTGPSSEEIHL